MTKVFKHNADRLILNEVTADTILRKGEMVLVGDQVKVGDGVSTAQNTVGIGGIPIVNSEQQAKNLQNGSIVCIDIPSTAYDITSATELGMVTYDESTYEITSINGAILVGNIIDLANTWSGYGNFELWFVNANDPTLTHSIKMIPEGPYFHVKQFQKGSLDDHPNISSISNLYLYKYNIYPSDVATAPTKTIIHSNFDTTESKEAMSKADGTLQFIGGQEGSTTHYVVNNGELYEILWSFK